MKSLYGERGLMYLNGKALVIDDFWNNGTVPAVYWLWRQVNTVSEIGHMTTAHTKANDVKH